MHQALLDRSHPTFFCTGLRTAEDQLWLSRLAQCRAVHLLAAVDHANAALLWDRRAAMRFRWLWHDVTSYEHYDVETMHMPPILTGERLS